MGAFLSFLLEEALSDDKKITFGIIVYKEAISLNSLLNQIRKIQGVDYEVLVVDNTMNSDVQIDIDKMLSGEKERVIYRGENIWFSKSANKILAESSGDYIALLCGEHSLILDNLWIEEAVKTFEENDKVGILGHIVSGPGIFHWSAWSTMAGRYRPDMVVPKQMKYIMKFPREFVFDQKIQQYIHGGVMLLNKKLVDEIGPFDEGFQHALADAEYSLRCILNGWGIGNMEFIYSAAMPDGEGLPQVKSKAKIIHTYPSGYKNMWSEELI